jgi:hypothetical protein
MLDFIGQDPESPANKCPAVYVDQTSGDFYFQGKTVSDPVVLAEIAKHSPMGADESVVRLPATLGPVIVEAAEGRYEQGRVGHGPVEGLDLIRAARRSVVHLEMRDTYDATDPAYLEWRRTSADCFDWGDWLGLVSANVGRGVRMRRARVVSEPVTDYIRWEHMLTAHNVAAGEEVRWLPRRRAFDLLLPGADFFLIDARIVVFNFSAGDGADTGHEEFTTDPDTVARCVAAFEAVWERAVPHGDYQPA